MRSVLALATGLVAIVCGLTIFAALLVVFIGDQHDYAECRADQQAAIQASVARGDRSTVIAQVAGRTDDRWLLAVEEVEEGGIPSRQWAEGSCGLDLAPWRRYRVQLVPGQHEPAIASAEPLDLERPVSLHGFSALNPTARYAWCGVIPFAVAVVLMLTTLRRHPAI